MFSVNQLMDSLLPIINSAINSTNVTSPVDVAPLLTAAKRIIGQFTNGNSVGGTV
jgi:hypothetical protein